MLEVPQLKLSYEARKNLGIQYVAQIEDVKTARQDLIQDTYRRALEHYEGKAVERDFPWPGASNAVIPIIPTHTDAIYSKLYNGSTSPDVVFMIRTAASDSMIAPGISGEDFAAAMQKFSIWVERNQVNIKDVMEEGLMITCKYGDVFLYAPWVQRKQLDFDFDGKEFQRVDDRITLDQPVVKSIHPEDFYMPIHETAWDAVQTAKFCAYAYPLDKSTLELYQANKQFESKSAKELIKILEGDVRNVERKRDRTYFVDVGDGRFVPTSELKERQEELIGIQRQAVVPKLSMYHVFARERFGGEEVEVNFHVHEGSGIVPYIAYNHYDHKRRPFVQIPYFRRDGVAYNKGIPEMLFNTAEIMNQLMRDVLDNNKIRNTKIFLARRHGPIKPGTRLYPSRMLFVDNMENDFKALNLGDGNISVSINDLILMQQWGERRTGITDFNLGQEKTGRTPATSVLARLEESGKRIDMVMRRIKRCMGELWYQVLALYMQFGNTDLATTIGGTRDGKILATVWDTLTPEQIFKHLVIEAQASTQNLSKTVQRQEALALFGQVEVYYERVLQIARLVVQSQNPVFTELLQKMLRGGHQVMERFLDSFEIHNQGDLNIDFEKVMEEAGGTQGIPDFGDANTGRSNQVQAALGAVSELGQAAGPVNPPGRPEPGQSRPTGS